MRSELKKKFLIMLIKFNTNTISIVCGVVSSVPITLLLLLVSNSFEDKLIFLFIVLSIISSIFFTVLFIVFTSLKMEIDKFIKEAKDNARTEIKDTAINYIIERDERGKIDKFFNVSILLIISGVITFILLFLIIYFQHICII